MAPSAVTSPPSVLDPQGEVNGHTGQHKAHRLLLRNLLHQVCAFPLDEFIMFLD